MRSFDSNSTADATSITNSGGAVAVCDRRAPTPAARPSDRPRGIIAGLVTVSLQPMPAGTISLRRRGDIISARVSVFGLTPGSCHAVELRHHGAAITRFTPLTAGSAGAASAILTSSYQGFIPDGSTLVILAGGPGEGGAGSEVIARAVIAGPIRPARTLVAAGAGEPDLRGTAAFAYDAAGQTLTVAVSASGLTPGAHAAHVRAPSRGEDSVRSLLMDLTASSYGQISGETGIITGVTAPVRAAGVYLSIHQGDCGAILDASGQPTAAFRPLLCASID
jgi:hypothetical protein